MHPAVILLTIYNLLALMASWGINIWLPTLLKEGGISIATVGFLTALPYAAGAVMMYLVSISSDRTLERKWHMIVPTMLAGVFMLLAPGTGAGHLAGVVICFVLVSGFFFGRFGPFWALPSEIFPASVVGVAIALTNGVGNLGGFFGPFVFGYVKTATNSFGMAIDLGAWRSSSPAWWPPSSKCLGSRIRRRGRKRWPDLCVAPPWRWRPSATEGSTPR